MTWNAFWINTILKKSEIKYLGQIIDANGRKSDTSRSSAINNMCTPTNVPTLQTFLGLANY